MRVNINLLIFLTLFLCAGTARAVAVYECEDANGNRTFQDRCPPGTKQVEKKDIHVGTGSTGKSAASSIGPLTLYVVPDCDSCEQVKEFLAVRHLSVVEKNVNDNVDLQNELKEKAGDLRVPTLLVGDQVITGYNRTSLLAALKQAGYKEPEEDKPAAASKPEE